jgi:putative membrane protein
MEFKNRAIAPMVVSILYTTATAAMAQVGEIPERFGQYNHGHDMMWGSNQWGGFGMVLGPIFMILIVVGIVAAIIYLLRLFGAAGPATSSHAAHDRALALLKERYAKGEIDSTEFGERKKLLAD